jgi:PadR family transcriptional regulator, regulatory protein AphA
MRSNRSQFAVLGLLADGPRSGYEIGKEVSTVLSHFWNESDGQIYPVLHRLSEDGLAEVDEEVAPPGRQRRRYRITPDGQDALADWLAMPAQPLPPRHELLLKLFFGRHARPGDLSSVLAAYRARAVEAAARLEGLSAAIIAEHRDDPDADYWLLSVAFGRDNLRATIAWCAGAIETINRLEASRS